MNKPFRYFIKSILLMLAMLFAIALLLYYPSFRTGLRDMVLDVSIQQNSLFEKVFGKNYVATSPKLKRYYFYPSPYIYDAYFQVVRKKDQPLLILQNDSCQEGKCVKAEIEFIDSKYSILFESSTVINSCFGGLNAVSNIEDKNFQIIKVPSLNVYISGNNLEQLNAVSFSECIENQ